MINKLIQNRYLTLPSFDQSPPSADPAMPADFVRAPGRVYNIHESESSGFMGMTKTSTVQQGAHGSKAHRTFRWLPWVLGKVSCISLSGGDVLTGTMSGCWLVVFRHNGIEYAGHIGTDTSPATPNTIQAKAAWRNAVTAGTITPIAAFNPVGTTQPAPQNLKGEAAEFYGAFSTTGQCYNVILTSTRDSGRTRRIAHVANSATTVDVTAF